ncbi:MAG: DUF3501 family protein [Myxococcota bacterium]
MNRTSTSLATHLLPPARYERERELHRATIIDRKRGRRVRLGDCVSVVFEDRETLLYQAHEIRRIECANNEARFAEELAFLNRLVPVPNRLTLTLYVDGSCEGTCHEVAEVLSADPSKLNLIADGAHFPATALDEGLFPAGSVRYLGIEIPRVAATAPILALYCDCYRATARIPAGILR